MTLHFSPKTPDVEPHRSQVGTSAFREVSLSIPSYSSQTTLYNTFLKRTLDVFLILLTLPLVLPLIGLTAALIAMDGRNPFYSQMRVGYHGQHFRMWKLRTMVHNADALLQDYLEQHPHARAEWDSTQKLKKDPRITFIGCFLRKTSMDELPQFFNVLNGTMSLVGPRPMMINQRGSYTGRSYYDMRPGITGLWQISDRNHCEFQDRVLYDDQYHRDVSLKTDARILAKTVTVVLKATGY